MYFVCTSTHEQAMTIEKNIVKRKKRSPNSPPAGAARFVDTAGSGTIADTIYQKLFEEIVSVKLKPGTPISEQEIAQSAGVSRTPVREAVLRLSKNQLVEVVSKSGTYVGRIPVSTLPESRIARQALEVVNVRAASEAATEEDIARLNASLVIQAQAIEDSDHERFYQEDDNFHALIAEVAGFPGIWTLIQQVKLQVDRYRHLTMQERKSLRSTYEEHSNIVAAIEQKDPALAVTAMNIHMDLERLQMSVVTELDVTPEYFITD